MSLNHKVPIFWDVKPGPNPIGFASVDSNGEVKATTFTDVAAQKISSSLADYRIVFTYNDGLVSAKVLAPRNLMPVAEALLNQMKAAA